MMSRLILMRHGQASFGAESYDALSAKGEAQARATGAWLAEQGQTLCRLWHGPRHRQVASAHALSKVMEGRGISPCLAKSLDEFGEVEEIMVAANFLHDRPVAERDVSTRQTPLHRYVETMEAWSRGAVDIPGRADFRTFRTTVKVWLDERANDATLPSGRCELAVTSAGVIAVALCEVLGLPDKQWMSLIRVIHNASLTELVFSQGRYGLLSFNGVGHLPTALLSKM